MTSKSNDNNLLLLAITQSKLKDTFFDLTEIVIDSGITNDIIKDIPILSTINNLYSAGKNLYSQILNKKIITFLYELEKIDISKRETFIQKISSDSKFSKKVNEQLLITIERFDRIEKSKILGKLFNAYINELIDYEIFMRYCHVLDRVFLEDLAHLERYTNSPFYEENISENLHNVGLLSMSVINAGGSFDSHLSNRDNTYKYSITSLGLTLIEILDIK